MDSINTIRDYGIYTQRDLGCVTPTDLYEYPSKIQVAGSNFLDGMAKLKEQAEAQQRLGHHYMRVSTISSDDGHAENIDIDALLALDLSRMEPGAYTIGDRNYRGDDMSQDVPRLAVRKVNDTPSTYEFGTFVV
ncbi:MAG: hypothetical protein LBS22_03140 [Puniceicoccales bacterium]|nr:hypothetical protein [Puniceicoccales bacterium]